MLFFFFDFYSFFFSDISITPIEIYGEALFDFLSVGSFEFTLKTELISGKML